MRKIILATIFSISLSASAADFVIQVSPSNNSVSDDQVSSISSSKVSGLGSFALKSSLVESDIPSLDFSKIIGLGSLATKSQIQDIDVLSIDISKINNLQSQLDNKVESSSLGTLSTKSTITNSEVADGALSISKLSDFASSVLSSISSTLSNYVLSSSIPTCNGSNYLQKNSDGSFSCAAVTPSEASIISAINSLKWKVVAYFGGGAELVPNKLMGSSYSEVYSENVSAAASNLSVINNSGLDNLVSATITCLGTVASSGANCGGNHESVGIVFNAPRAGDVKACIYFTQYSHNAASGMEHYFKLVETPVDNGASVIQEGSTTAYTANPGPSGDADYDPISLCSYFHFSSGGNKAIRLFHSQQSAGMNFINLLGFHMTVEPL